MRVDHSFNQQLESQIQNLEKKLDSNKGGSRCCGCFGIIIMIIALLIGGIVYASARSGLVDVPLISKFVYERPQPTYVVSGAQVTQQSFIDQIKKKSLVALLSKQQVEVPVVVSDVYLTQLLEDALSTQNKKVELAQVAVLKEYLEVYIANGDMVITMGVVPSFVEGKIKLDVTFITLGNLSLPKMLGSVVIKFIGGSALSGLTTGLKFFGEIKEMKLAEKSIEVLFIITKNAQWLNKL